MPTMQYLLHRVVDCMDDSKLIMNEWVLFVLKNRDHYLYSENTLLHRPQAGMLHNVTTEWCNVAAFVMPA